MASGSQEKNTLDDVLDELARAHRVLAMLDHTFATMGSVSLRDSGGQGFWTKRSGIGMEEVFGPAELVLTSFDGKRIAGSGGPPMEWAIRAAVFQARPDVNVVVYCSSFYSAVFSATGRQLLPVSDEGKHFDSEVPQYVLSTGKMSDPAVAAQAAAALGNAKALLLKNNGVVTVAGSVPVAVLRAIFIEKACQMQLSAEGSRYHWGWLENDAGLSGMSLTSPRQVDNFWGFFLRQLERLESGASLPGDWLPESPLS
jgi:ribulose-5-phosphate 4-epimerase/fuculose-1-phosphate aldolase